tara:strand:- start:1210 stop:1719 length:510 start_codon:yes stop_codon:yes gene_type:complete
MLLSRLFKNNSYKIIFNKIYAYYLKKTHTNQEIRNYDNRFYTAYQEICKIKPTESNQKIIVKVSESTDKEDIFDNIKITLNCDGENFACDFVPWKEVLGCELEKENCTTSEALAHVFWEMTFYGFSAKQIEDQSKKMQQQIKDIEEGKEELIEIKDMKKFLDELDDGKQ